MALACRAWRLAVVAWLGLASAAAAQTMVAEATVTAGGSTQAVAAAGTQLRLFGEPLANLRVFAEGTWGGQRGTHSDLLGAAYPYGGSFTAMETYAETTLQRRTFRVDARGGRYRTPFGIHARGDHAYAGFLRPPMVRYDGYFGLSNTFLEGGVAVAAGVPALHGEVSLGVPQDVGDAVRRTSLNPVVRLEGYHRHLIVGVSHMRSRPYDRRSFVSGNLRFSGVDVRYMRGGVQLRGEWITGQPFDRARTRGGYIDAFVHRPRLGPATLVARVESLDYDAGRFSRFDTRYTLGARVPLPYGLLAQVNAVHQPNGFFSDQRRTAADLSLSWVVRVPR